MHIKLLIKQIPFAVRLYKKYINLVHGRANRKILQQLGTSPYWQAVRITDALKSLWRELPQSDQRWAERVELERKRLLRRQEPLIDGSLGRGGLYDDGVTIQDACLVSKPLESALLLFLLTRATKPSTVIELGTNVGISSAYIAAALKLNGENGKIATFDASPYRQRLAQEAHRNLGLDNVSYVEGLFRDTIYPSLSKLGSIDLAFIDGHHQYQPTLDYFEEILKFSTPDTVFVFDDIRWSRDMKKAWSQIQSDERLGLVVDLSTVGVCVRCQPDVSQRYVFDAMRAF
jgi:predicted O-methyltransferase YrrM